MADWIVSRDALVRLRDGLRIGGGSSTRGIVWCSTSSCFSPLTRRKTERSRSGFFGVGLPRAALVPRSALGYDHIIPTGFQFGSRARDATNYTRERLMGVTLTSKQLARWKLTIYC